MNGDRSRKRWKYRIHESHLGPSRAQDCRHDSIDAGLPLGLPSADGPGDDDAEPARARGRQGAALSRGVRDDPLSATSRLCAVSEEYRGCIRLARLTLQEQLDKGETNDDEALAQVYADGELVWATVELVFLKSAGASTLAHIVMVAQRACWRATSSRGRAPTMSPATSGWPRWCAPTRRPSSSRSTGPLFALLRHLVIRGQIYANLALGRFAVAVQLVRLHPHTVDVDALLELLARAPLNAVLGDELGQTDGERSHR